MVYEILPCSLSLIPLFPKTAALKQSSNQTELSHAEGLNFTIIQANDYRSKNNNGSTYTNH